MKLFNGTFVSEGIQIGPIRVLPEQIEVTESLTNDVNLELDKYRKATQEALDQSDVLIAKATDDAAKEILEIHKMMLEDLDYQETVVNGIQDQKYTAIYAVKEAGRILSQMFFHMEDEYMRARSADVLDISDMLIKILSGQKQLEVTEPSIFVGNDIMPSQLVELDPNIILGFAFTEGSVNSHSGIVARNMSLPMVCQINESLYEYDGLTGVWC